MRKFEKRLLGIIVGVIGLSMTAPVYAQDGSAGSDLNSGDSVMVNYNSLTRDNGDITNKVGNDDLVINTDFGYAWDDLSYTYVKTVTSESSLTTDAGYQKTDNISVSGGTWYVGTYATLNDLDEAIENGTASELPSLTMDQIAQNLILESPMCSAEVYASMPKLVLHNYTDNDAKFSFAISKNEYSKYNSNGVLMLLDEERKDVSEFSNTFTSSGDNMVSEQINLASGATVKYGVTPAILPNEPFASFSTNLTINFTSVN